MKAILEFQLPEEQTEFELATHGGDWHSVVWDIDQKLRNYLKHGHPFKSADEALEELRKSLHEELRDRKLDLS